MYGCIHGNVGMYSILLIKVSRSKPWTSAMKCQITFTKKWYLYQYSQYKRNYDPNVFKYNITCEHKNIVEGILWFVASPIRTATKKVLILCSMPTESYTIVNSTLTIGDKGRCFMATIHYGQNGIVGLADGTPKSFTSFILSYHGPL